MSTRLQVIILVALVVVFALIIFHIYKKKLEFKFCLPWMLFLIVCMVLTCFPKLLDWISEAVGIAAPINMLFVSGFAVSLFIIYGLTMTVSKLTANMSLLTQKVALLEKELEDVKEDKKNGI